VTAPLVLQAPAKINLTLEVLSRRADGYHEVRMLMAGVSLADELSFEAGRGLSLSCDRPELDCSEGNLILRAARALQKALGREDGARIALKKRIPLGGGLAGGSTDAAAALKGLNALWQGGLGMEELIRIGATLGSDIPFCMESGWAYATGRGEKLARLSLRRRLHFVLVNPGFEVSTKWAYGGLAALKSGRRNLSRSCFEALQAQNLAAVRSSAVNDLEPVTADRYPEIGAMKQALLAEGALLSRMSGSGPTVWGWFRDAAAAKKACQNVKKEKFLALAVHTISALSSDSG
jgi:4-diphosphocytidyl-2-C-methyl-D-erythritol kinase